MLALTGGRAWVPLFVVFYGMAQGSSGIVASARAADLFAGFVAGLSENGGVVYLTSLIAGAIGGPIYWLWLGRLLRRDA